MGLLEGTDVSPSENLEAEDENNKKVLVPNPMRPFPRVKRSTKTRALYIQAHKHPSP
jgi:hypothetical protein